ncbi:MAG: hypothetical protein ACK55I_16325, partial [bacterium]
RRGGVGFRRRREPPPRDNHFVAVGIRVPELDVVGRALVQIQRRAEVVVGFGHCIGGAEVAVASLFAPRELQVTTDASCLCSVQAQCDGGLHGAVVIAYPLQRVVRRDNRVVAVPVV